MSNLSTHVQPKARPMTKEDKEHWRSKVKRLISNQRSDLKAVFESDIQKIKDKKWKSFLKSLNLDNLFKKYQTSAKAYWKFKDDKDRVERELKNIVSKDYEKLKDKVNRYSTIRQWSEDYSSRDFDDINERDYTDKVLNYLSKRCYEECEKQFNQSVKGKSINDLEQTEELLIDALHISNSDPAILGLIKHHLQKAGISNLGILDVDLSKFKMIAGSK